MKLQKEFADFYRKIKIDSETNALKDKREVLQTDIENKFPEILEKHNISLSKSDIRMIDQGSYKYKTTIKSDIVDRDVAVMFPLDTSINDDPRKIKEYLRDAIHIPARTVSVKEPCVRVSYFEDGSEYMHIDLPVYAQDGENVYLARGKVNGEDFAWEEADPDGLNEYLCGKIEGDDQLRRVICYIKKWRNGKYANSSSDHEIPPSIGLTLLACDCFTARSDAEGDDDLVALRETMKAILDKFSVKQDLCGNITEASVSRVLPVVPYNDVFKKMKDASDSYMVTFFKKLSSAVDDLTNALNLEAVHDSGVYVRKVLGEEFDVPQKEAVVKNAQNRREHSFG